MDIIVLVLVVILLGVNILFFLKLKSQPQKEDDNEILKISIEIKKEIISPYISVEKDEARISVRIKDSQDKLRRNDLIEKIHLEIGISLSDSSKIFEEIIEEILSSLENGNDVKISNFGTFFCRNFI